jgi:Uma2 family endonuclease
MALSNRLRSRYDETLGDTSEPSERVGARMTLAEFLALPEEKPYLEWDNGVVSQKCLGDADHSSLLTELCLGLGHFAESRRVGIAFPYLQMVTECSALTPDISYHRREHLRLRDRRHFDLTQCAPDIAVEIGSPEESIGLLTRKCLRYIEQGTTIALVVDREDQSILVFRAERPVLVLRSNDLIDLDEILPGFDMTVDGLFAAAAPPAWLFDDEKDDGESSPDS